MATGKFDGWSNGDLAAELDRRLDGYQEARARGDEAAAAAALTELSREIDARLGFGICEVAK